MTDNAIDSGSNGAARAALASLIDLHGPALLHEPDRLKRQLDGALPDARREVELILSSMSEEVPHALLAAHSDEQLRTLFPQLVNRLVRGGIEHGAAIWAVRTWAHALAVAVEGRDAERPDGMRRAVDRQETDQRPRGTVDPQQHVEDREAARRSSTAEVLGLGTRPVRLKAPSTVRPTGPLVSPPPAAETLVAFDASRERVIDAAPEMNAAVDEPSVEAPSFEAPVLPEVDVPAEVVAPAPAAMPPAASAHEPVDLPTARSQSPDREPLSVEAAEALPAASDASPEIAIPVAGPAIRTDAVREALPPTGDDEPPPFAPQRRSSSRTFALAAAIAAAVIVVGATLWPAPQPMSTPDPKPIAPTTARATPTPSPATAAAPVGPSEPVVAMTQPASPANPTSEPQRPPEVPSPAPEIVVPPAREVASPVEAKVATPVAKPSTPPAPKPAPRVAKQPAPVVRPAATTTATPKPAVAVATTAPKPAVAEQRKSTAASPTCTRSTCGSVVSVRAIDDVATRDYEVIVRLDDRTIRAVRMPARWSPGARVRVTGSRFEPVNDR